MSLQVTIGGDTYTATSAEMTRELRRQSQGRVFFRRSEVSASNLKGQTGRSEVKVGTGTPPRFGGVLRDVRRGEGEVEVIFDSYERYARDGERSDGLLEYDGDPDTDVYNDALDDVPQLSAGTLDNLDTINQIFSYASPAKRIRTVAKQTNAEIRYNPDKTVDVVQRLGADNTAAQNISPSNRNVVGRFRPDIDTESESASHLVMLGSGEGEAQEQVVLVPGSDGKNWSNDPRYENVVTYTASEWSAGDDRRWGARVNKDATDTDTLERIGRNIVKETEQRHIEVDLEIKGVDVSLGDTWQVVNPKEDFDEDLRIAKVTESISERGTIYDVQFSNRINTREQPDEKVAQDSQRYNRAFEGGSVPINAGGSRQPVTPQHNAVIEFYYPDEITHRHRLNVQVIGLPYRAYSRGGSGSSAEIANEIPYNLSTITGTGTYTRTMQYPGVGEDLRAPNGEIYIDGSDVSNWSTQNIEEIGGSSSIVHDTPTDLLETKVVAEGSNNAASAIGGWATPQPVDLSPWDDLFVTWEVDQTVNSTNGTATSYINVGGDADDPPNQYLKQKSFTSGFNTTHQIDLSGTTTTERIRILGEVTAQQNDPKSELTLQIDDVLLQ